MKYSILLSTFTLGLVGGFGHCVAMCHPFVLYISSRSAAYSGYKMLIPHLKYNLGRSITYSFLGGIVGALGSITFLAKNAEFIQNTLTIVVGALLIIYALFTLLNMSIKIKNLLNFNRFNIGSITSPFLTGVILGFLPCGLVMGALLTSAVSTNAFLGALSMLLFGLGTTFAMLTLALFGTLALKYVGFTKWVFCLIMILTGIYFIYTGVQQ